MDATIWVWLIFWAGLGAVFSAAIAANKGLPAGSYFFLGAMLGVLGIVIAAAAKPAVSPMLRHLTPATSEGWHTDPTGRFDRRYFDGRFWTRWVTRDAERRQYEDPV